jgi:3-oxoacyl-[acyl-carrier-protein] synthase II
MASVVITGFGVVSPLGHSVGELTRRWRAGERAASAADGGVQIADIPFDAVPAETRARSGRLDRICRLFLAASFLAVEDAALTIAPSDAERVGLSFGTGLGCLLSDAEFYERVVEQGAGAASPRVFAYTVSSAAAGEVSIALGIHGPNVTSHMGLAAGLGAIAYGCDLIALGKADVVLAGGADANGSALVDALRDMGLLKSADAALPFGDAPGVWPAEGAAVAILERADHARARTARALATIDGYACGFEPTLTERAPQRDGIASTMRHALAASGRTASEVGAVLTSAHGTVLDTCERAALIEVLGEAAAAKLIAPKKALGETFGASGALGAALAAGLLAQEQGGRSAAIMINALCYSGSVATLVLGTPDGSGRS